MAKAPAVLKLSSSDIRAGMLKRWKDPEYAILWEVGEATGAGSGRYADAVIMSLWPSRGLELHGVEIKVSRSDWKREAADPKKAEAVAKFCDRWYIHTPKGLIADVSEVPPAWGVREFDGQQWTTLKEAEKTGAAPVTRGFLAAMLRRADVLHRNMIDDAVRAAREAEIEEARKRRESFRLEVDQAAERKLYQLNDRMDALKLFEAEFGSVSSYSVQGLGAAALAVRDALRPHGRLQDIENRFRAAADAMQAAREAVTAERPAE